MKNWEKVLGNDNAKKALKESFEKQSFLHNYLFIGEDEEGKIAMAREMAKAILCEGEEKPCGRCKSCQLFQGGEIFGENHPDYEEIFPTKTTSKESIKKEAVMDLMESTRMKSYRGKGKVYVIHGMETMTVEGQNALLKTLEEPLEGIHFILLTKSEGSILPTVLSRSNVVEFNGMTQEETLELLMKRGYSESMARKILVMGSGSLKRAESIASGGELSELRREVFSAIHKVVKEKGYTPLGTWKFFEEKEGQWTEIFFFLESWARDVAVYFVTQEKEKIANTDFMDIMVEDAQILGERSLQMMNILHQGKEYLHYNGNKQLVIENMLLEIGG